MRAQAPAWLDNYGTNEEQSHCPHCGIVLLPGFVRCGRCHDAILNLNQAIRVFDGADISTERAEGVWRVLIDARLKFREETPSAR